MDSGVRMGIKEILAQLPYQEGRMVTYEGVRYNAPYETITIGDVTIEGLRENTKRLPLLESIIQEYKAPQESLLDIGSNLGTTAAYFRPRFREVCAIEGDKTYVDLSKEIHPGLNVMWLNLNVFPLTNTIRSRFSVVTALSMIEYIDDKAAFVHDLWKVTENLCIVEGHSEDIIPRGRDTEYEALLKTQAWEVVRRPELTDPGLNAPAHSVGRPLWVCMK